MQRRERERGTWVSGPHQHGARWRIVVGNGAGRGKDARQVFSYATQEEAEAKRRAVLRQIKEEQRAREALTWEMATPEEEAILSRFRAVLARQAIGKSPTDPLIGTGHDRWWIRRQVGRLCQLAKVPVVCAHALRGTHVSAAYEEGESPAMVARSVGHAGTAVGQRHYATQEAQAAGRQKRALTALQGEVTGKSFDFPMTSQGPSCTPEAR